MNWDLLVRWLFYKRKKETISEEDLKKLDKYRRWTDVNTQIKKIENITGKETIKFVVFGDTRGDFRVGRDIISHSLKHGPDFILMTGDIVRRGRVEEYLAHHLRMVSLAGNVPVIPVPGNHEEGPDKRYSAFMRLYGTDRFVFDCGFARFVGFNNNSEFSFTKEHLNFLDSALSRSKSKFKFVIMHKPPIFLRVYPDSEEGRGVRWRVKDFHKLMIKTQVTEIFMGHVHGFVTMLIDNVRYTISAGGGARLEEMLENKSKTHHYLLYEVSENEVKRIRYDWNDGEWQEVPF